MRIEHFFFKSNFIIIKWLDSLKKSGNIIIVKLKKGLKYIVSIIEFILKLWKLKKKLCFHLKFLNSSLILQFFFDK